jgi:hypothetical protein
MPVSTSGPMPVQFAGLGGGVSPARADLSGIGAGIEEFGRAFERAGERRFQSEENTKQRSMQMQLQREAQAGQMMGVSLRALADLSVDKLNAYRERREGVRKAKFDLAVNKANLRMEGMRALAQYRGIVGKLEGDRVTARHGEEDKIVAKLDAQRKEELAAQFANPEDVIRIFTDNNATEGLKALGTSMIPVVGIPKLLLDYAKGEIQGKPPVVLPEKIDGWLRSRFDINLSHFSTEGLKPGDARAAALRLTYSDAKQLSDSLKDLAASERLNQTGIGKTLQDFLINQGVRDPQAVAGQTMQALGSAVDKSIDRTLGKMGYVESQLDWTERRGREATLAYAGDFDPNTDQGRANNALLEQYKKTVMDGMNTVYDPLDAFIKEESKGLDEDAAGEKPYYDEAYKQIQAMQDTAKRIGQGGYIPAITRTDFNLAGADIDQAGGPTSFRVGTGGNLVPRTEYNGSDVQTETDQTWRSLTPRMSGVETSGIPETSPAPTIGWDSFSVPSSQPVDFDVIEPEGANP